MDIQKSKAPFVIAFHALMIIILTTTFMTIFNHCVSSQAKQKNIPFFLNKIQQTNVVTSGDTD